MESRAKQVSLWEPFVSDWSEIQDPSGNAGH